MSGATNNLLDVVSHTPPETEGLNAWMKTCFIDAVRHFVPETEKSLHVVVVPATATGRWPTAAAGWIMCG